MTHSYPPGGGVPRGAGAGPLLRNTTSALGPPYSSAPAQTSPNSQSNKSQGTTDFSVSFDQFQLLGHPVITTGESLTRGARFFQRVDIMG